MQKPPPFPALEILREATDVSSAIRVALEADRIDESSSAWAAEAERLRGELGDAVTSHWSVSPSPPVGQLDLPLAVLDPPCPTDALAASRRLTTALRVRLVASQATQDLQIAHRALSLYLKAGVLLSKGQIYASLRLFDELERTMFPRISAPELIKFLRSSITAAHEDVERAAIGHLHRWAEAVSILGPTLGKTLLASRADASAAIERAGVPLADLYEVIEVQRLLGRSEALAQRYRSLRSQQAAIALTAPARTEEQVSAGLEEGLLASVERLVSHVAPTLMSASAVDELWTGSLIKLRALLRESLAFSPHPSRLSALSTAVRTFATLMDALGCGCAPLLTFISEFPFARTAGEHYGRLFAQSNEVEGEKRFEPYVWESQADWQRNCGPLLDEAFSPQPCRYLSAARSCLNAMRELGAALPSLVPPHLLQAQSSIALLAFAKLAYAHLSASARSLPRTRMSLAPLSLLWGTVRRLEIPLSTPALLLDMAAADKSFRMLECTRLYTDTLKTIEECCAMAFATVCQENGPPAGSSTSPSSVPLVWPAVRTDLAQDLLSTALKSGEKTDALFGACAAQACLSVIASLHSSYLQNEQVKTLRRPQLSNLLSDLLALQARLPPSVVPPTNFLWLRELLSVLIADNPEEFLDARVRQLRYPSLLLPSNCATIAAIADKCKEEGSGLMSMMFEQKRKETERLAKRLREMKQ